MSSSITICPLQNPPGPYWADDIQGRNGGFYYSIVPIENGKPKHVRNAEWLKAYAALGELGYLFRDSGRSFDKIVVSLDKPLAKGHIKKLEDAFLIKPDDGNELHFC